MAKDKIAKAFLAIPKDKFTIDTIAEMIATKYLAEGDIVDVLSEIEGDGKYHKRIIKEIDDGTGIVLNNGKYANLYLDNSEDPRLETFNKNIVGGINEISVKNKREEVFLTSVLSSFGRNNKYGAKGLVNIVGDSISQGYDSSNHTFNSYASILKRLFQIEFKTKNLGFEPFQPEYLNYTHIIKESSGWEFQDDTGEKGANTPNGACYFTTNTNEFVIEVYPLKSNTAIHYTRFSGGGTANVFVNGNQEAIINCGGEELLEIYSLVGNSLNSNYRTEIKIVPNGDGEIRINGISFMDEEGGFVVNNFSQSGRKLLNMTNSVIDSVTRCDLLIFALNHNDSYEDYNKEIMEEKLNLLKIQCNLRKTNVMILDFRFNHEENDVYRKRLRKLCSEINGAVYINFPNMFKPDGTLTDITEKLTTYSLFTDDTSHPSDKGMEVIASTIAKKLGLTYHTKKDSIDKYDVWYILPLENGFSNCLSEFKYLSKYRVNNGKIELALYVKNNNIINASESPTVVNFNNIPIKEHSSLFTKEEEYNLKEVVQDLQGTIILRSLVKSFGVVPRINLNVGNRSSLGAESNFLFQVDIFY